MEILEECYKSDKRKVYHAQKYAEFAIYIHDRYSNNRYIQQAYNWISELIKKEDSKSYKTRDLHTRLEDIVTNF